VSATSPSSETVSAPLMATRPVTPAADRVILVAGTGGAVEVDLEGLAAELVDAGGSDIRRVVVVDRAGVAAGVGKGDETFGIEVEAELVVLEVLER